MNKEAEITLKLVALNSIYLEILEDYQRLPQNKFKRKTLIKQLIAELEVDAQKEFLKAFELDQETLRIMEQSYDYTLTDLAKRDIPSVVTQTQFWSAFRKDQKSVESNIHRILTKPS